MNCKFCGHEVVYGPGFIMVEEFSGGGFIAHEECYQDSGTDEGYIERLHRALDGEDDEELYSFNS